MHRGLLRQLKRLCAVENEADIAGLLEDISVFAQRNDLPLQIGLLLQNFGALLERIEGSYQQYERDLELRSRSLDLSSKELSNTNKQLRGEVELREKALNALRKTLQDLLQSDTPDQDVAKDDLTAISQRLSTLVAERETSRMELTNQQFALDQHAIVSITDLQGNITYANDSFVKISGYSRDELLGKNHRLIRSDCHPPEFFHTMWDTISQGRVWKGEVCNRTKNGELYWVAATIVPCINHDWMPYQYIAIRTDITAMKNAEAAILAAKEAAEAGSRAKSEFLANMSHEIRTPMNGIIGMTELALDTPLNEEQREYLQIVKTSADSLLTIINDILDFSKIEAGKLSIETISFDLPRLLQETLKTLSLRAHQKGLELICDLGDSLPERFLGDPGRVRQVLVNLIGNAIKFTETGEIILRALTVGHDANGNVILHISVQDTGIGIPIEKQSMIFEAFSQEDGSISRRYGGSGLGLTISNRLVGLMGGRMWVDSTLGEGSTFHFTLALPLDESNAEDMPIPQSSLLGRHILVVDDNEANRQVLCSLLQKWQIRTEAVDSGQAALNRLYALGPNFDCILLDVHMPELDGFAVAERLLQQPLNKGNPPIIMLTSGGLRGDAQRCRDLGISGYFSKPIAGEELLLALQRLFGQSEQHENNGGKPSDSPLLTRHLLRETQQVLRILLVEDHPINQKLATTILEKWGHEVFVAVNGQEAITWLENHRCDLVLMDMQMPVMDGVEATHIIRQRETAYGGHLPIIAMTANAMTGDREVCLAAGMDDYLAKPVKAADLLSKINLWGGQTQPLEQAGTPYLRNFDYAAALANNTNPSAQVIASLLIDGAEKELGDLAEALFAQDEVRVKRLAHTFAGTLAILNIEPAYKVAHEIAQQTERGNFEVMRLLRALEQEIKMLLPHLHVWLGTEANNPSHNHVDADADSTEHQH